MKYKKINIVEPESEKPEEDVITVKSSQLVRIEKDCYHYALREGGELTHKAIFLSNVIDGEPVEWIIVQDSGGNICAVPLTQKE